MKSLQDLREKLRLASDKFDASRCHILQPGEYRFSIVEAKLEYDDKRQYDYVWVKLDCDGELTQDRFPINEQLLWKLRALLAAMGLDVDSFEPERLVGCTGKLTAEKQGDKTFYRYSPLEVAA
jgi:hypothetical protein